MIYNNNNITNKDKTLHALQDLQLKALVEYDRICRKHNINYSLSGGTLLGAIRDGGIIPWDDDIDVMMTRKNFFKLVNVINDEINHDVFSFDSYQTNNNYHSFPARLYFKNTNLSLRCYEKKNIPMPIFIDIFIIDNVADNKKIREINDKKIKYYKCAIYGKWLDIKHYNHYKKITQRIIRRLYMLNSFDVLHNRYNKLVTKYNSIDTKYIADNSMTHNTLPAWTFEKYVDIEFMGHTVSIAQGAEKVLDGYYGKNWAEWLPIEQRGMWHSWANFDLGKYKEDYDLPENYRDYMQGYITPERLLHIQKVCFDMMDEIDRICQDNNIKYYLVSEEMINKTYDIDEMSDIWNKAMTVAMPRDDYVNFGKIANKKIDEDYFYQSKDTQKNYYLPYAKLRLNNSQFKSGSSRIVQDINQGLWINIIPLDNASQNSDLAKKDKSKLKKLYKMLTLKWIYKPYRVKNLNTKNKITRVFACLFSIDSIYNKFEQLSTKYNTSKSDYYIDSTYLFLKKAQLEKSIFGEGVRVPIGKKGHNYVLPTKYTQLSNIIVSNKGLKKYINTQKLKTDNYDEYIKQSLESTKENIKRINKKIVSCSLGVHDHPDYVLSCNKIKQDIKARDERIEYIRKEIKRQTK